MTDDRYQALNENPDLPISQEEIEAGWIRCWCEWDGLVIHVSHPEAQACYCLKGGQ